MARIFLIDEDRRARQALRPQFEQDPDVVCGEAGSRQETLERIGEAGADIVIMDISLARNAGCDLISYLRGLGVSVVIYTREEKPGVIDSAFAAGAQGYVTKGEGTDVLLQAVSRIESGRFFISPKAAENLTYGGASAPLPACAIN